ncbi:zinc ribbon domain-containing protein [Thermotoga caldifontis]|uniref:zinc ribbon domain-containing protein n=1 Tax=Thermotoga caldifontis TaxID=1508419 RepID=UPI0011848A41|nr:zinc ribbon domain-containing protein [Thermotoga caldifontis]
MEDDRIVPIFQERWKLCGKKLHYSVQPEKIDPNYTSQTCSVCGHVSKDNRPDHARL